LGAIIPGKSYVWIFAALSLVGVIWAGAAVFSLTQKPPHAATLSENLAGRFDFLVTEVLGGRFEFFRWTVDRDDNPSAARLLTLGARSGFNWIAARVNEPAVETLFFDIRFKHFQKLTKWRNNAMRLGRLTDAHKGFVPASVRHGNRVVRVRLRLKGDRTDHLRRNKWSYRVEIRGGDHLMGLRRFSIQHPGTRVYETEALYLEHIRREGVLAPRYSFVEAVVNGESIGRMALEEHFSKELLAAQRRPESVIVRFDERQFWHVNIARGEQNPYDNYATALVKPFRQAAIDKSPGLKSKANMAVGLLMGFQRELLPASAVFNADLVARFLAVSELWSAEHALHWINLRFYYNPITGLLEPVAFDNGQMPSGVERRLIAQAHPFWRTVLKDPYIYRKYRMAVRDLAERFVRDGAETWLEESGRRHLEILHAEFPYIMPLRTIRLKQRARFLLALPKAEGGSPRNGNPETLKARVPQDVGTKIVSAYIYRSADGTHIEVANKLPRPVEVLGARWTEKPGAGSSELAFQQLPLRLAPTRLFAKPVPFTFEVPLRASRDGGVLELEVREQNATKSHFVAARASSPPLSKASLAGAPSPSLGELVREFPFLEGKEGTVTVKAGEWKIERVIRLPEGVSLDIPAGTTLRFQHGAGIIAKGPVNVHGTEAEPVVFRAAEEWWSGIAVLNAKQTSSWRHVFIENVAGWNQAGWNPTGAISFYQSPAVIENCHFENTTAEDMLNLVRARYRLQGITVRNTASDALDADFAELALRESSFFNIGGDGVDLSGTLATGSGLQFQSVADKAISVGEKSTADFKGLSIRDVGTGVASKDKSETLIADVELSNVRHAAFMAYVKKPEYGAATLEARNILEVSRRKIVGLAQIGSTIKIDGEEIDQVAIDVDRLYDDGFMKK